MTGPNPTIEQQAMADAIELSSDLMSMHADLAANPPRSTPTPESRADDYQTHLVNALAHAMRQASTGNMGRVDGRWIPRKTDVEVTYEDDDEYHPEATIRLCCYVHCDSKTNSVEYLADLLERLAAGLRSYPRGVAP